MTRKRGILPPAMNRPEPSTPRCLLAKAYGRPARLSLQASEEHDVGGGRGYRDGRRLPSRDHAASAICQSSAKMGQLPEELSYSSGRVSQHRIGDIRGWAILPDDGRPLNYHSTTQLFAHVAEQHREALANRPPGWVTVANPSVACLFDSRPGDVLSVDTSHPSPPRNGFAAKHPSAACVCGLAPSATSRVDSPKEDLWRLILT